MGFMGLSHWVESDNASDCRWALQSVVKEKNKGKLRRFFKKELNDNANCYNTCGVTNIALIMEDEGICNDKEDPKDITPMVSELMTEREFAYVISSLTIYVSHWKKKQKTNEHISRGWSETNFLESYERMLTHCKEKFNKRFKKNEVSNNRKSVVQRLRTSRKVS